MRNNFRFDLDGTGSVSYFIIDTGLPVWVGFSTREGGVSSPPYAAANMAYHVGDDSLKVAENRRLLSASVTGRADVPVYTASQVHGNRFLFLDRRNMPMAVHEWENQPADSLITAVPKILLGIMTADCLPVLLIDRQLRAVAAVHSGWRGILAGVVPRTIRAMKENYGVDPTGLLVLLGPCIGRCCYQVGEELIKKFAAQPPFAVEDSWYERLSGDYYLDLVQLQVLQLRKLGVLPTAIKAANLCTACENFFFSYRRERGITGRQIAVVGLM